MQRLTGGALFQADAGPDGLQARADERLDRLTRTVAASGPIAVAVSGGSDSLAALHLTQAWAVKRGRGVIAFTVDHGLRAGSADEARRVAEHCARIGIEHQILNWSPDGGKALLGGLQRKARMARHRLLGTAARKAGATGLVTGHTLDDQFETFLMRVRQGSGWYGLGGMDPVSVSPAWPEGRGVFILRPLLGERRSALQEWLRAGGVAWLDDPSNGDTAFERVRVRERLAEAPPALLSRLARVQAGFAGLRQVERAAIADLLRGTVAAWDWGHLRWRAVELGRGDRGPRVLSLLIQLAAGTSLPPRGDAVHRCFQAMQTEYYCLGRTLGGAHIRWEGHLVALDRDPGLVAPPPRPDDEVWDGRFERPSGPDEAAPLNWPAYSQVFEGPTYPPPGSGPWRGLAATRLQALTASMKS